MARAWRYWLIDILILEVYHVALEEEGGLWPSRHLIGIVCQLLWQIDVVKINLESLSERDATAQYQLERDHNGILSPALGCATHDLFVCAIDRVPSQVP